MTRAIVERGLVLVILFIKFVCLFVCFFEYIYFLKSVFEYLPYSFPLAIFSYIYIFGHQQVFSIVAGDLCGLLSLIGS